MAKTIPACELNPLSLADLIRSRLNSLLAGRLPHISRVSVTVTPPSAEQFQSAWQSDGLQAMEHGTILIQPDGDVQALTLRVPMPFHGVFVLQGRIKEAMGESTRNTLWTWCPWLAEAAGLRLYRENTHRNAVRLRIGTGGGDYLDIPMIDAAGNHLGAQDEYWCWWLGENFSRRYLLIQKPDRFPKKLQSLFRESPVLPPFPEPVRELSAPWDAVRDYAKGLLKKPARFTDFDDLQYHFLMTYPQWLASRICKEAYRQVFRFWKHDDLPADDPKRNIIKAQREFEASLFPKGELLKTGKLHAFRPVNPVDAVSQLTQIKRYDVKPSVIDHMPAVYHQNHPSFYGRICPVETPESESLGISLHLAKGATVDADGMILPCPNEDHGLGWSASLLPFFEHNDAVRNMMGAKNLKQGVPVAARCSPLVATAEEDDVLHAVAPLVEQGIIPNATDPSGRLAFGTDLLVAYMPFRGLNFEDAIVVNRRLADEGVLDLCREERLSSRIKPGFASFTEHQNVLRVTDDHLDERGLAKPRTVLTRGTILLSLWHPRSGTEHHVRYQEMEHAELVSIDLDYDRSFGGRLTYRIRRQYPLAPGDKLMGRHGNKGVVSVLLPPDQMPRLPESDDLPASLRGRSVDLVLNPHGVVSRMNLGQLMETHLGWLLHALPPEKRSEFKFDCKAFAQQYPKHAARISAALKASGLDATGKIRLLLPDGQSTEHPVVVGFQHIVRLRHIPTLKSQSRGHNANSRYDIRTGQAVHGRRAGGGQRIGEMELWALAGHQADNILAEMLYAKADVKAFDHAVPAAGMSSTWEAIQDHLFAVGIAAKVRDGGVGFEWAPLKKKDWSSGTVTGWMDFSHGYRSAFQCARCGYRPTDLAVNRDGEAEYVELGEVLKSLGWACPDKPVRWEPVTKIGKGGSEFKGLWKLRAIHSGKTLPADVQCSATKSLITVRMSFVLGKKREKVVLTAMGRSPGQGGTEAKETKQGFTPEGIGHATDDPNLLPIGRLRVTCSSEHPSVELRPVEGRSVEALHPVKDGLFCPDIFGEESTPNRRWGCIELPIEIPFPKSAFLGKRDYMMRDTNTPSPPPPIRYVPVLPAHYRSFDPDLRDLREMPDIDKAYRGLLKLCLDNRWKQPGKKDPKAWARLNSSLRREVNDVFKCTLTILGGKNAPKQGLLRRHGMGRRVDCSGRLVVIPDPEISPSVCKVPVHILWELVSSDVAQWLKEAETFFSEKHSGRITLAKAFDEAEKLSKHVLADANNLYDRRWNILQKKLLDFRTAADLRARAVVEGTTEDLCLRTLDAFLAAHPDKLIILNRQPSLHKYSMLAFRPVPTRMSEGEVLRISPLVCGPFNADFDGDEMALHWPLADAAHQEAKRLLFRNHLLSEAGGNPLPHFAQDVVLGLYQIKKSARESALYDFLPDCKEPKKCCRAILPPDGQWDQAVGMKLLKHICSEHARDRDGKDTLDQLERSILKLFESAFNRATGAGTSFGYFDLSSPSSEDLREALAPLDQEPDSGSGDSLSAADKSVVTVSRKHLVALLDLKGDTPGCGLAALIVSGARKPGQASQLLAMRGLLGPGAIGFDANPREFFFQHSLAAGCDRETYFQTVYNGRSSMCDKKLGTGKAGWLTRELVGGLWDVVVVAGDCGAKGTRSAATCKLSNGVCQHCYGTAVSKVADYADPATGFYRPGYPAGLVAAQSIGERGTQLSMQSFHTAKRAFTPDRIRKLLNSREFFDFAALAVGASDWDKDEQDAFRDLAEALYALVPELTDLQKQRAASIESDKARVTVAIKSLVESRLADHAFKDEIDSLYLASFLSTFRSIEAYSDVFERHLAILWRTIYRSPGKKLSRLATGLPPLAALGFRPIRRTLYELATEKETDTLSHPASRIMMGCFK